MLHPISIKNFKGEPFKILAATLSKIFSFYPTSIKLRNNYVIPLPPSPNSQVTSCQSLDESKNLMSALTLVT